MHIVAPLGAAMMLVFAVPCSAGLQAVGPELRQEAYSNCMGDALRLCPQSLIDEGQVVSCMSTKRPQLSQTCRATYDKVARVLKDSSDAAGRMWIDAPSIRRRDARWKSVGDSSPGPVRTGEARQGPRLLRP